MTNDELCRVGAELGISGNYPSPAPFVDLVQADTHFARINFYQLDLTFPCALYSSFYGELTILRIAGNQLPSAYRLFPTTLLPTSTIRTTMSSDQFDSAL